MDQLICTHLSHRSGYVESTGEYITVFIPPSSRSILSYETLPEEGKIQEGLRSSIRSCNNLVKYEDT